MQLREVLKNKAQLLVLISFALIMDVIPIILIMVGIWIVKYFSNLLGFEDAPFIKILTTFSEGFMIILYILLAITTIRSIYKIYKDEVV